MKLISNLICGLMVVALATPADGDQLTWRAGAGRAKITPTQYMWMSGYGGRDRPAEGKLTELWAKALVLEDAADHRALLLTLDLVGVHSDFSAALCQAITEKHGFARSQIAICTSHTHTGPVVGQNLGPLHYLIVDPTQQALIEKYTEFLASQIMVAVDEAVEAVGPCQLSWGSGRATFAVNRRNNREPDVPQVRVESQLEGPFDHDVPVLAVRDANDTLRAVVFGYACHSTVLSFYQWSGDYPGFAQIELEEKHPDCIALFFAGCGADQNPLPRRSIELAEHYGRRLATAVDEVLLTHKMRPLESQLTTDYQEVDLDLAELPDRAALEADAQSDNRYTQARAKMLLKLLEQNGKLDQSYPYPVAVWKLGNELQWVFLGGEVVVDYALRLKAELSGIRTWVAGYANDVMAYIPSRRVLIEGGYEGGGAMVYYGLPTVWAPQVEERIVDQVHQLLGELAPAAQ